MGAEPAPKTDEIAAILDEIRQRVRARHPSGEASGVPLPDLLPVLHARDAAEAKVAAIGSVNPRPPGLVNNFVQSVKRTIARSLDWHVREQVEFNRGVMSAIEAILEALNANNRALAHLGSLAEEARQLKDIAAHWAEWRVEWERKLSGTEVQFLRAIAEYQNAFQHRVALLESNFRELIKAQDASFREQARAQHQQYETVMARSGAELQQRFWADMEKVQARFEKLIHEELRVVRQRAVAQPPARNVPANHSTGENACPTIDWFRFAARFRGSEEYVREGQRRYLPLFQNCASVLDVGCGRGEFLELMREAGIPGRGIDLSAESVALCRSKGLEASEADLFSYLGEQGDGAFDGILCGQVVEHLPPARVPEFIGLAASKLTRGGVFVIETPNPESLAIFATHFYLDPTHQRPLPPALLVFYFEEAGFGNIRVERSSPAAESIPAISELPPAVREALFGALDYAVVASKL